MKVDEKREKVLTNFNGRGSKKIVKTDHNVIECEFSFLASKIAKSKRIEMYNVRNTENLIKFKSGTSKGNDLTKCVEGEGDIKIQGKKWLNLLNKKIIQSFDKIRIDRNQKTNKRTIIEDKINKKEKLKKE